MQLTLEYIGLNCVSPLICRFFFRYLPTLLLYHHDWLSSRMRNLSYEGLTVKLYSDFHL